MSRIGKKPVKLPEAAIVSVLGGKIVVKGPKGELEIKDPRDIDVEVVENEVLVSTKKNSKLAKTMHGTTRALIANMAKGVSEGWEKTLELIGTGYRAEMSGGKLVINIGYSHPVEFDSPEGIQLKMVKKS